MQFYIFFLLELIFLFLISRELTKRLGAFVYRLTGSEKWTVYIMSVLFLPGTFIHELAHFLAALVLLVPVRQMELVPKVEEGKVSLGRVPIAKVDFVRRTLVGFSPLIFGVFIIFFALSYITGNNLLARPLYIVLAGYLVFEVGNTMYLSKKDLEGVWVFFILLFLVFALFYFLGFRFFAEGSVLFSANVLEVVETANIFLLVPIAIDIFVLLTLSLFSGYN